MWGTRYCPIKQLNFSRFIPTDVGNAAQLSGNGVSVSVHPHGCGERKEEAGMADTEAGSSPRMWGTRDNELRYVAAMRFIPTDVGNARFNTSLAAFLTVHPHGCGERQQNTLRIVASRGSSPRMWGTPGYTILNPCVVRFIPTDVGNAHDHHYKRLEPSVHPHGCGERVLALAFGCDGTGSSPRMWGTPSDPPYSAFWFRFIPTDVGNAIL